MRKVGILILILAATVAGAFLSRPQPSLAKAPQKGKLLYLTLSAGFKHQVVPFSRQIVKEIGERSGAFETTVAEDVTPFTAENLANYNAVMFYTTGELPMNDDQKSAFINFVRSGHGFVGVHSATDTFYMWSDYADLIGAYFNEHPWHQQVTIEVVDTTSPIVKFLGESFQINDEIYQMSDFQAKTSRVLLKLDPSSVDVRKDAVHRRYYGWPLAWTRTDGKGRVFYTALGHEEAVWKDSRYQTLLLNGIKWVMGQTD